MIIIDSILTILRLAIICLYFVLVIPIMFVLMGSLIYGGFVEATKVTKTA